ncbi:Na(+)-translocating NADH-quinone reductase subunit C [Gynuella sp.]|uniref:Na(+)-translocating NADH-quinone reductase subunit C n=1 Tax=Gynuella sp. TaxID=2969146 RepID=UPI003D0B5E13
MSDKNSIGNTIKIAFLTCLACSIVVSMAAVSLKPIQEANKANQVRRSVLEAAGIYKSGQPVAKQFESVTTHIVDLRTGEYTDAVDAGSYDQKVAAKDPSMSEALPPSEDTASIKRQEYYSKVYTVEKSGQLQTVILPVRGYGLWSTMYGFIALDKDLNTVVGFGFYEQGETPGLGGEVDNPKWKALWPGKKIFADDGSLAIAVKKGNIDPSNQYQVDHVVDGLSGATLTTRGVDNLVHFWMGKNGYGPFLKNLAKGEV